MAEKYEKTLFSELIKVQDDMLHDKDLGFIKYKPYNFDALVSLLSFIHSYAWTDGSKEKAKYMFENIRLTSGQVELKSDGVYSSDSVRCQRIRASNQIKRLIGKDIVERISNGSEQECKKITNELNMLSQLGSSDSFFDKALLDGIETNQAEFSFKECKQEIQALALISLLRKERLLGTINQEKLGYLVKILKEKDFIKENGSKVLNRKKGTLLHLIKKCEASKEMSLEALKKENRALKSRILELEEQLK